MKRKIKLLLSGLFLVTTAPIQAAVPVNLPEYWGSSDWLGLFTLVSITFAVMIRLKVLKPRFKR
jgi:hypothetical protein